MSPPLSFIDLAAERGVSAAAAECDRRFGDYSQAPPDRQPARDHVVDPK